jgi:hypothetical protein
MAVVSKEPPSHSVYQRMDGILIRLGRIQLSSFVPGLALQLRSWEMSESMGNHDSEVVDASSVD